MNFESEGKETAIPGITAKPKSDTCSLLVGKQVIAV